MTIVNHVRLRSALLGASSALALAGPAMAADCGVGAGRVSIIGNDFPAIQTVAAAARACDGLEVEANLTAEHESVALPGMQGDPAEYTVAVVATSSIVPLLNEGLIRPLDELIAQYGQGIPPQQIISVNGETVAVGFMANAQHLFVRADVLEAAGVAVPATYEEVLAAAEAIQTAGLMEYPVAGTYAAGWDVAEEFVNMYTGLGGEFFEPGSPVVSINNETGVAALEMMKALSAYMNPDFLTYDSNAVSAEWEAGNVAIMNLWGSRAATLMDEEGSAPEVHGNTTVAAAPTVGGGAIPATTLWWDGWTIARNISDEDAAASFAAMAHGTDPAVLTDETMGQAVWMVEGYEPSPASAGVIATIEAGARPYPMLPYMGILHTAIGDNIADFLAGSEDAATALADVEAAYTAAAREAGFVQ